jgi:hypothetical protein
MSLDGYQPPSHQKLIHAHAHRVALAVAQQAYNFWQRQQLVDLTDRYRDLTVECEIAEAAYRQLCRCPHLYSEAETQYGVERLSTIYHQLAPLAWKLDVLTYRENEEERFMRWREEANHE